MLVGVYKINSSNAMPKPYLTVYRISRIEASRIEAGLVYRPGVFGLNLAIVAGSRIKAGLSTHAPRVP